MSSLEMISHNERTEQLHANKESYVEVRSCRDLAEKAQDLAGNIGQLDFDFNEIPLDALWDIEFANDDEAQLTRELSTVGLSLRSIARKVESGQVLNVIEESLAQSLTSFNPDWQDKLLVNDRVERLWPSDRQGLSNKEYNELLDKQDSIQAAGLFRLGDVADFINHYYSQYDASHAPDRMLNVAAEMRNNFLEYLDLHIAEELIPDPEVREGMIRIAKQTPIVFVDPLRASLDRAKDDYEARGYFTVDDREAFVVVLNEDNPSDDAKDFVSLQHFLFHELLHACFVKNYKTKSVKKAYDTEQLDRLVVKRFFDLSLEEAVVEKVSFAFTADAAVGLGIISPPNDESVYLDFEDKWRHRVGLTRSHVLMPEGRGNHHVFARHALDSTYPSFRAVYDEVFAKIDWQKAGLSQKDAEGLLANAVFEQPKPAAVGSEKWSHRKLFFESAKKAGASGVFNRVGRAIKTLGIDTMLDILSAESRLDITDSAQFPHSLALDGYLTSKQNAAFHKNRAAGYKRDGPQALVNREVELARKSRERAKELEPKARRAAGLLTYIDTKLGRRDYAFRTKPTKEERADLVYAITGVTARKPTRTRSSLSAFEKRSLEEYMTRFDKKQ